MQQVSEFNHLKGGILKLNTIHFILFSQVLLFIFH